MLLQRDSLGALQICSLNLSCEHALTCFCSSEPAEFRELLRSLSSFVPTGRAVAGAPQKGCEPKPIRSRATPGHKNGVEHLNEGSNNSHNCGMIQRPTSVCRLGHVMLSAISRLRPKK